MLSPSTEINLSVSLCLAHSLCAASDPSTPCTRLAHGHFDFKSAQFSSMLGSSKLI